MNRIVLVCCLLFSSLFSFAQLSADTSRVGLSAICDRFMETFKTGKYSDAIQLLKQNSNLGNAFIDNMDKTVNTQMSNVINDENKIVGYNLIDEKSIQNILVRRRYLLKFNKYFLTFEFYLYNNGSDWKISGFYYEDNQKGLF